MDCLIAAHAIRLGLAVLAIDREFDREFEAIATCTPLKPTKAAQAGERVTDQENLPYSPTNS